MKKVIIYLAGCILLTTGFLQAKSVDKKVRANRLAVDTAQSPSRDTTAQVQDSARQFHDTATQAKDSSRPAQDTAVQARRDSTVQAKDSSRPAQDTPATAPDNTGKPR